jgi:hypothetical protein
MSAAVRRAGTLCNDSPSDRDHRVPGRLPRCLKGVRPRRPAAAAFALAREHRRPIQKGVVVDLLDEEIRYVGARDEPACPAARIDQRAIGVRLRPIGQDHGTHDHPVDLAPADDALLHILVVIDAPQSALERDFLLAPVRWSPPTDDQLARSDSD